MNNEYYKKTIDYYNRIGNLCGVYSKYPFLIEGFKFYKDIDRHFNEIIKLAKISNGMNVLEAGCGFGGVLKNLQRLSPHNNYTGITIVEKHIIKKQFKNIFLMNYDKTKFKDSTFDRILFIESFSHSYNKLKTLKEMHRILKKDGIVFILDLSITNNDYRGFFNLNNRKKYKDHINFFGDKPVCSDFIEKVAKRGDFNIVSFKENVFNDCDIEDSFLNKFVEKIILIKKLSTFYNYYILKKL